MSDDYLRNRAIVNCSMCDLTGYRPGTATICDHIDHRPAYDRGMAAVREILDKSRKDSVRNTVAARQLAFNQQQLVDQQRQAAPPASMPEVAE